MNRIIKCTHELKFASWNLLQTGIDKKQYHSFWFHWKELQSPPEPVRSKQYTEFEVFSSCSWANSTSGKPLRKYETKNVSYLWFAFRILRQCEWEILRFFNERAYSLRCLVSLNVQHECNAYFSKTRAWDRTLHRSK